jgi:hypothetical protein
MSCAKPPPLAAAPQPTTKDMVDLVDVIQMCAVEGLK